MCKCGLDHDQLTSNHLAPAWLALQLVGECVQEAETIDGVSYPYERTEMRNCPAGSTLGVTVDANGTRII